MCEIHGTRASGHHKTRRRSRRPEGHVFHTSRQAMIKTYYSTSIRKTMVQNCSYFTQMKSTTTAIDDSNRRRNKLGLGCSREATAPLILIFKLLFLWLNIGRHFKGITQFLNCHSPKHTSKKYYPVINIFRKICTKIITKIYTFTPTGDLLSVGNHFRQERTCILQLFPTPPF